MTEMEFKIKKKEIEYNLNQRLMKRKLRDLKHSLKHKKHIQFTKIALVAICFFIILNCTAVEVFSCYAMLKLYNLDALSSLISSVVVESITLLGTFISYSWKSLEETKAEEQIKLEREKLNLLISDDEAVG